MNVAPGASPHTLRNDILVQGLTGTYVTDRECLPQFQGLGNMDRILPDRHTFLRACRALLMLVLLAPLTAVHAENAARDVADAEAPDPSLARQAEQRLDELMSQYGPYDPALLEVMSDLGAYYMAVEDYERAAAHYHDALQLVRVSEGLYSPRQLQVLQLLISSLEAARQWQQVDDLHHLAFYTESRLYAVDSEEYLESLYRYTNWVLRAWRSNLVSSRGLSPRDEPPELREILSLYQQALDARYPDDAESDPQKLELLYGRAQAELEVARHFVNVPRWMVQNTEPRYIMREVCGTVTNPDGSRQRVCTMQRVPNPQYSRGQSDEHSMRVRRANQRVERTLAEMESLMQDDGHTQHEEWASDVNGRLAALNEDIIELSRQARRAAMRQF